MSNKYDDLLTIIANLEKERKEDKRRMALMEDRLETMERKMRASGIETGKAVNISIEDSELKDIYRLNSKDSSGPIIVELSSVISKEKILRAVKSFNKNKPRDEKLNTSHLQLQQPKKPVFISETLTQKTQKIFQLARAFKKAHSFMYCWTLNGTVYLRKDEKSSQIRINSEADLENLRKTQ
ncbi:unnamed protein product [Parnassius apollo]|uniref:(apollo) hypothetical protein n=1 Tax=Parnassius apollo TaxID=110799 RepID=A0A8S3XVN9_PARAO|nr:unnamed protein product [Parnassius apollo]